jgi:uncharacterized protein YndB with AHSA1/START domain
MNTPSESPAEANSPMEIVNRRILAAPREVVFEAFSNPDHLSQWWGPNGFTNTFAEFDFRPGGAWRLVMHGPDGANYENESEFIEIARPEKLVFVHLRPMHRYVMTVTFGGRDPEKTVLTWQMVFDPSPENAKLKHFIFDANEQNFDRLEACLKTMV